MTDWTTLFERYRWYAIRFAKRRLPDDHRWEAEDLVQTAWLQVWRQVKAGTEIHNFRAYFFMILRRRCQDYRERLRFETVEFDESMGGTVDPPRTEERLVVEEAMGKLPLNWRRTVIARTVLDMSAKQSARYLIKCGLMAPGGNETKRAESMFTRGIRRLRETVAA